MVPKKIIAVYCENCKKKTQQIPNEELTTVEADGLEVVKYRMIYGRYTQNYWGVSSQLNAKVYFISRGTSGFNG